MEKALYLIPVTLGDTPLNQVLPEYNKEVILQIKYFIVENVRSAIRFLKKVSSEINIDNLISSRSTIRDADIAEVSATYIQQQILQQASATLLATANQSPSIALQLI